MAITEQLLSEWRGDKSKVRSWLRKSENDFDFADLQKVLELFQDKPDKLLITQSWLDKEERGLEDLQSALRLFPKKLYQSKVAETVFGEAFSDKGYESSLAESWIGKKGKNPEDLQAVLELGKGVRLLFYTKVLWTSVYFLFLRCTSSAPHCGEPHIPKQFWSGFKWLWYIPS